MNITVAGGHGQIAMLLHPILKRNGHHIKGLIRNPAHSEDLKTAGAEPVLCDLEAESDLGDYIRGSNAVVFAAGAGPGSGAARKWTLDRDGALKLIEACKKTGIKRYVMISAMNPEQPRGNEVFQQYLQAKAEADAALRDSGLDYTIIRPGKLTDEPGSGKVSLGPELPRGDIPRADVAAVVAGVLETLKTAGHQFDLTSGSTSIEDALTALVQSQP